VTLRLSSFIFHLLSTNRL